MTDQTNNPYASPVGELSEGKSMHCLIMEIDAAIGVLCGNLFILPVAVVLLVLAMAVFHVIEDAGTLLKFIPPAERLFWKVFIDRKEVISRFGF